MREEEKSAELPEISDRGLQKVRLGSTTKNREGQERSPEWEKGERSGRLSVIDIDRGKWVVGKKREGV